jgi:OFA family oxalate/formate antiporter-like MFS transporter
MAGAYLLTDPPPDYEAPMPASKASGKKSRRPLIDVATSTVVRTRVFYVLWLAYALGTTAGTLVISQLVPFARAAGWSARTAALAISVGAAGSATGRFFSGWMSDHFGRLFTLRMIVCASMVATPALYFWRQDIVPFFLLLFVLYYCYGTQLSVYTALAGDRWGIKYLSTNYGLLLLAWGFAGVLGPVIGSRVYVATGTYQYAFVAAAVVAAAALSLLTTVRPMPLPAPAQPLSR